MRAETAGFDLDGFYSQDSPGDLRRVLGDDLLYHHGYFESAGRRPGGTESLPSGLRRAVRCFYPDIAPGMRVLDVGCGWGGVARMLAAERKCSVHGVTVSESQASYCRGLGLEVTHADIERNLPAGRYDLAVVFESLSHVRDKERLLARLERRAGRLVLSVNCLHDSIRRRGPTFGGSMVLCSRGELLGGLERAGWAVRSERDRRFQALPTLIHWRDRLDAIYGREEPPGQLGLLRRYTAAALAAPAYWCRAHPLLDIVAS